MSHMCMQTVEGYMVCDKESLHPEKRKGDNTCDRQSGNKKNPLGDGIKGNIPRVQN